MADRMLILGIKRMLVVWSTCMIVFFQGQAQSGLSLYSLENHFNSSNYNPAFLSSQDKFTVSFFPIGGTNIGYNNQEAIRKLVSKFLTGATTDQDYKEVLQSMVSRKMFTQSIESNLLNIIFRSRIGHFNFRIRENEFFLAKVSGFVTNFISDKDVESVAVNQLQQLPAQAVHFREYSLGYALSSRRNNFSAGIRAKVYLGKSSFHSEISGSIQNELNNYKLEAGGMVYMSVPESALLAENGKVNSFSLFEGSKSIEYLTNTGNPGFGVDMGINWKVSKKLSFSLSTIDLGKINWKTNLNSKYLDGSYRFSSSSVTNWFNDKGEEFISKIRVNSNFLDSISNLFDVTYMRSTFSRNLPVTFFAGINYLVNPKLKLSFVDRYVSLKDLDYNSFSVNVNYELSPSLSIGSGYSVIGRSRINFPLVFLINKKFGQIYVGSDSFMAFLLPSVSEYANLSFGTCFYLFPNRNSNASLLEEFPFYQPKKRKSNRTNGLTTSR